MATYVNMRDEVVSYLSMWSASSTILWLTPQGVSTESPRT